MNRFCRNAYLTMDLFHFALVLIIDHLLIDKILSLHLVQWLIGLRTESLSVVVQQISHFANVKLDYFRPKIGKNRQSMYGTGTMK